MSLIKLCLEKIEVKFVAFEITERAEYRQFKLTQGDTFPPVRVQFLDDINDAHDITNWQVDFFFRKADNGKLINAGHTSCTLTDPENGVAEYNWVSGDTDGIGIHFGSFQLTTPDGKKQSIRDSLRFEVRPEIDGVSGCYYQI